MSDDVVLEFEPETQIIFDKKGGELPIHTTLRLANNSKALDVLFRVQTTSPSTYRVRPSHGRIAAGSQVEIQVMMVTEPIRADKFLVKYVTVSHSLPQGEFMKQFQEAEESAQEHRLRVSLVGETEGGGESKAESVASERNESPVSRAGSQPNIMESLTAELKEAKAKIQTLVAKNQELTKALEDSKVPLIISVLLIALEVA